MERRQFLIGAGSILTASFVSKAEMFLNNKNAVLPIIRKSEAKRTIYFVDNGFDFELRLNSSGFDFPYLTYREALEEYLGYGYPRINCSNSVIIGSYIMNTVSRQSSWMRKLILTFILMRGVEETPQMLWLITCSMVWTYLTIQKEKAV